MSTAEAHRTIARIFKQESPRLIAGLTRIVRDLGLAEELAQDALVAALEQWPSSTIPENPGAWLMATAKHRAINVLRRGKMLARKHEAIGHDLEEEQAAFAERSTAAIEAMIDDDVGDDLLRLVFTACHPLLSVEARVALTLRMLGGLTTDEIARAFLVSEPTIAQRIVRAKRTLAEARVPFEVPRGAELAERLGSVLGVVYLIFNEGYSATAGDDLMRPALCDDALRLGRTLADLTPAEAEVHALVALMELTSSRAAARIGPAGEPILLEDQDRSKWDKDLIARGLASLVRAAELGSQPGPYRLQAEIGACHARALTAPDTDWERIAALYEELYAIHPSPVVRLNGAVATSMAYGPAAGLAILEGLRSEPTLARYHLLPAARADFLERLGRLGEAHAEWLNAASLTKNEREKQLLLERAARCKPD